MQIRLYFYFALFLEFSKIKVRVNRNVMVDFKYLKNSQQALI